MSAYYCALDGCDKIARAKGYCDTHYRRLKKHGDASVVLESGRREPKVKGPTVWVITCGDCGETVGVADTPMKTWPYLERHRCPVGGAA